jgi:hypothetical protein
MHALIEALRQHDYDAQVVWGPADVYLPLMIDAGDLERGSRSRIHRDHLRVYSPLPRWTSTRPVRVSAEAGQSEPIGYN